MLRMSVACSTVTWHGRVHRHSVSAVFLSLLRCTVSSTGANAAAGMHHHRCTCNWCGMTALLLAVAAQRSSRTPLPISHSSTNYTEPAMVIPAVLSSSCHHLGCPLHLSEKRCHGSAVVLSLHYTSSHGLAAPTATHDVCCVVRGCELQCMHVSTAVEENLLMHMGNESPAPAVAAGWGDDWGN